MTEEKPYPPVLDMCCGPRMMWFDKHDSRAVYIDKRRERHAMNRPKRGTVEWTETDPDQIADFTALPFPDDTFDHVVFDPPHFERSGKIGYLAMKYGWLDGDWRKMLAAGFAEGFRVLRPGGTLVFKWTATENPVAEILKLTTIKPLYGHKSGKQAQTHWIAFLKPNANREAALPESPLNFMSPTDIEPPETPAEALSLAGIASTNLLAPFYEDELATVYLGEACAVLRQLPTASVDVVITDPPYSSGGMMRGDRAGQDCRSKYQQTQTEKVYDEFSGDNRDQRSFIMWCSIWMDELRRVTKPGAVIGCFTDWRQMPAMTDALQVAGLVWRGVVPWVKKSYRPCKGRWASQCEYLVWATNGPRALDGPCFPGAFTYSTASDKRHMTEKPVDLMHELCRIAYEPDAVILDPFMGSGTTLKAAKQHRVRCVGIELTKSICETACERLREPVQHDLLG